VVDILGWLLIVVVHRASVQAAASGQLVLQRLFDRIKRSKYNRWCRLKHIWVDGAYAATIRAGRASVRFIETVTVLIVRVEEKRERRRLRRLRRRYQEGLRRLVEVLDGKGVA
jgi:hypothetical protein